MITAILLSLFGILCIYCEFFLPGGVLALFGALSSLLGIVWFFSLKRELPWTLAYFVVFGSLVFLVSKIALWQIKRGANKNVFYLSKNQQGFLASEYLADLIGKKGIAECDLKPAGYACIAGHRIQVLAKEGFLSKGTEVVAIQGKGAHLIVQKWIHYD